MGARPLQGTERLEALPMWRARVVFGPQIIEYENWVGYAARLSKPAYFHGYTAIPVGNAPWSACKRWATGVLKGAREGGKDKGPRKGGSAKAHEKTRKPREPKSTNPRNLGFEPCAEKKEAANNQYVPVENFCKPSPKKAVANTKKESAAWQIIPKP